MAARDLPLIKTKRQLHAAAAAGARVRFAGVVIDSGDGYSGTFRNRWVHIQVDAVVVRVTATPTSPLGRVAFATRIEVAARLTGMLDLTRSLYFAERAQVLEMNPREAPAELTRA